MEVRRLFLPWILLSVMVGCAPMWKTQEGAPTESAAGQGTSAASQPPNVATAAPAAAELPSPATMLAGRELVQQKCSSCHGLDVAVSGRRSAAQWAEVIEIMVGHGLVVSTEESRLLQNYLAAQP